MKKIVLKYRKRLALVILTFLFFGLIPKLFGDDWGLRLVSPILPGREITEYENNEEYVPTPMSSKRKMGRELPVQTQDWVGRSVGYDMPLNPGNVVIPQGFLEEDSSSQAALNPPIPKPLKKPKRVVSTDTELYESDLGSNNIIYEGEYYEDGPYGQQQYGRQRFFNRPYMVDGRIAMVSGDAASGGENAASDTANEYGGLYNECSPALSSGYAGVPIVKPFGTGLLDNLVFFGGMTGFKNVLDGGENGNFGFTEGFNWSGPATPQCTISAQLGFRAIQSNLSGTNFGNRLADSYHKDGRNQYFVTAGIFKRDLNFPIQGGAALDWYQDDYYGKIKLKQIRCELSARTFSNLEYGFQGAFGASKARSNWINARENYYYGTIDRKFRVETQDYYLLFVRKHVAGGGVAEIRAGASNFGEAILSAAGEFPLSDRFTVNASATASFPKEGNSFAGARRETWDLSVGVVFYFRGGACSKPCNPCRPMFDVAGNGSFLNRIVQDNY